MSRMYHVVATSCTIPQLCIDNHKPYSRCTSYVQNLCIDNRQVVFRLYFNLQLKGSEPEWPNPHIQQMEIRTVLGITLFEKKHSTPVIDVLYGIYNRQKKCLFN